MIQIILLSTSNLLTYRGTEIKSSRKKVYKTGNTSNKTLSPRFLKAIAQNIKLQQ